MSSFNIWVKIDSGLRNISEFLTSKETMKYDLLEKLERSDSTTVSSCDDCSDDSISSQQFTCDAALNDYPPESEQATYKKETKTLLFDLNDKIRREESSNLGENSTQEKDNKFFIFGFNISHLSRTIQFITLASIFFIFTLTYGLVQELVTIRMASRKLALFISVCQFLGSTLWSFLLSLLNRRNVCNRRKNDIPFYVYLFLSMLRAIDVSMSNISMKYLNYPTKTIIKSSRVAFTIFTGLLTGKKYKRLDYFVAFVIVIGLVIFLHADSNSSVVFNPLGIFLLVSVGVDFFFPQTYSLYNRPSR